MNKRIPLLLVLFMALGFSQARTADAQSDLKIEGTYQIEKNQRHGWLILNVEIPEGFHIYALTQKGSPPPTKIDLAESDAFRLIEKFKSNKKPKVIEHDPIFEQRIEKYEGKLALMAPIEIASGQNVESVDFDLKITGQVCSDTGCRLFKNREVEIDFAGFYEKDSKKKKQ